VEWILAFFKKNKQAAVIGYRLSETGD
jgi:hypothetical protein